MTILNRIVQDVRRHLLARKQKVSISDLEHMPLFRRPTYDFANVLRQKNLTIIAELKKASPSQGLIRHNFDIPTLAKSYVEGGASALSVLTEPDYFQGSLENLSLARKTVAIPLLRKDFIVDPYQLFEAKAFGADAVLLIAMILDHHALYDLHQTANELGLACLVELYDFAELAKLDFDQVQMVGVNNRDLHTFKIDINHSIRVFEQVPASVVRISESGLRTAQDLAHVWKAGIDAVLIGETFMRQPNPELFLRQLLEETKALTDSLK